MLALLDARSEREILRVAQRIRFADGLEALWYLRQDLLRALAERDGEAVAQQRMRELNRLFKGRLPETMGPRAHNRFTA